MDLELIKSVTTDSPTVMRSAATMIQKATGYTEPPQHLRDIADLSETLIAAIREMSASARDGNKDLSIKMKAVEAAADAFMNYEMEIPFDIALLHALGALGGER